MTLARNLRRERCPICLAAVREPALPRDCLHVFDLPCLAEWLRVAPTCPVCKRPVREVLVDIRDEGDFACLDVRRGTRTRVASAFPLRRRVYLVGLAVDTPDFEQRVVRPEDWRGATGPGLAAFVRRDVAAITAADDVDAEIATRALVARLRDLASDEPEATRVVSEWVGPEHATRLLRELEWFRGSGAQTPSAFDHRVTYVKTGSEEDKGVEARVGGEEEEEEGAGEEREAGEDGERGGGEGGRGGGGGGGVGGGGGLGAKTVVDLVSSDEEGEGDGVGEEGGEG